MHSARSLAVLVFIASMPGLLLAQEDVDLRRRSTRVGIESQYLEDIRPSNVDASQAGVIDTGSVILYGQEVAPPFRLALSQGILSLNGVAVDPPVAPPWRQEKPAPVTPRIRLLSELTSRLRRQHQELALSGKDVAGALLSHIASREPAVASASWVSEKALRLKMHEGESFSMNFSAVPETDSAKTRKKALRESELRLASALRAGNLVIIGHGPVVSVPKRLVPSVRSRISSALERRSLPELSRALFHAEPAREMLFVRMRRDRK